MRPRADKSARGRWTQPFGDTALASNSQMLKSLISVVAIALTFALFYPYIRSILNGSTKPHTFSWVIWGFGTLAVFIAQMADGAGIGAWAIGLSALITCYVALLSWIKRTDLTITPADWVCLVSALLAVPIWAVTSNALWAVIILTAIDLVGFGPTIRKAFSRPHEEPVWFYAIAAVRNSLVILALQRYTPTTVVFPGAVGVACLAVALYISFRRRAIPLAQTQRVAQQNAAAGGDP